MAKDFNTNIDLNKNSVVNGKIDPQTNLPTTNLYEGRIITHKGEVYIYYNGSWLSKSKLAELAEDLVGRPEVYHEEFTFQATANTDSVRDGLATIKSIKGNTVLVNQFLRVSAFRTQTVNGVTLTNNGDGSYTLSGSATANGVFETYTYPTPNHKYYCKGGYSSDLYIVFAGSDFGNGVIGTPVVGSTGISYYPRIYFTKNLDLSTPITIRPIIIDLTLMFNAGNEPTTVEEFERLYPNIPTEYNEGSLLNLNADSIKSVGFNQWDEEWENGTISYDGNTVPNNNAICSKNYIEVLQDTDYFFYANSYVGYYTCFDKNYKNVFPRNSYLYPMSTLMRLPANCCYIKFYIKSIPVYKNNICINLSHSGYRNGEYEPYKENIVNLPLKVYFPDGMNSIGEIKDEIVWNEVSEQYTAIQRIGTRAYQTGDENLTNVLTDKTNTIYVLAEPIERIVEDYDLIEYEVSDFGTEGILSNEPTTPIVADIQYGFNAVDVIRNNLFNIKDLFKLLSTKLSLTGGIMSGAIDMSSNPFINARFEPVEELPSYNNSVGRQVFRGKPHWWNGKEWITFPENSEGGGATGDFWNLLEANPETDYSIVQITNHLESIFPLLSNSYGTYLNSRNIYVDLSKYNDSYGYIMDLFGDIQDVPIGVRYHIFVGGYNNSLKIDFPIEYSTNWSFTHIPGFDGYTSELYCIPYSKAIKIEFIKLSNSFVWVDVENYGGMPGYSTATATNSEESTNNIVNYCNNNNVEINYNKETGNAIFNLVDILSSITTRLK